MDRRVKLFLIRHSISRANHVRHIAGTDDLNHPLVAASQELLDPALSTAGERMATEYGPVLRERLRDAGFNLQTALIGSSALRRAKQTAALLFEKTPNELTEFPHFTENGRIPENTPIGGLRHRPDWNGFLQFVATQHEHDQFIVVGHGSYLRTEAWPFPTQHKRFGNLDGFVVEAIVSLRGVLKKVIRVQEISCPLSAKIAVTTRKMKRSRSSRKQRKQRGGMPFAYFKDGAQMIGTHAEVTGLNLATSNGTWARTPLDQNGGGTCCNPMPPQIQKQQKGGFPPSVMGAFASNGARLIPVAAYMGYQLWNKTKKTRKQRRSRAAG